ncbi:MAG: methylmalonyl-CoA mutase family protein [Saprospiraceae bacterium]|nr:methylmalonyl-CoA mutase family protein [Saprospiraceae bacterium]
MTDNFPYRANHQLRILTAGSLFDGHDVAINVIRRILVQYGVEVIHLGHNRSAREIVQAAIQEDVQAIAITSYQGGHMEFFGYLLTLLEERGAAHIRIFGGGGGTILPQEIETLHAQGITRIYSPDDGRRMGLQPMVCDLMNRCDFPNGREISSDTAYPTANMHLDIAQILSETEREPLSHQEWMQKMHQVAEEIATPILGITGTGGAGKSSLIDEWVLRYLHHYPNRTIAIISVDPTKRKTGGALLGDRIRMNAINDPRVYMRSMATRSTNRTLGRHIDRALDLLKLAGFDLILLETSGIGQGDSLVTIYADVSIYVMTPEFGAATQLEKIDMLDFTDVVAINKFDKLGSEDALAQVRKQMQRNRNDWNSSPASMPVYATVASRFQDPGINDLFVASLALLFPNSTTTAQVVDRHNDQHSFIPNNRTHYLSEIVTTIQTYNREAKEQSKLAGEIYALKKSLGILENGDQANKSALIALEDSIKTHTKELAASNRALLKNWPDLHVRYRAEIQTYRVRNKDITATNWHKTLSGTVFPKISLPTYADEGEILHWCLQENLPGHFPFTAGVFPFKRKAEDPTRMFAGEGSPERTNQRFHYLSEGLPASRLSTAFDSVTLYGEDPADRMDIYGKVGNSGVSVASLDDAKKLYSGFDLCDPTTSVSLTINGPAAIIAAFFLNAAIDQKCEEYIKLHGLQEAVEAKLKEKFKDVGDRPRYHGDLPTGHNGLGLMLLGVAGDEVLDKDKYDEIRNEALQQIRGTVQADILKEDQAQNTCIFSIPFSLRLMGDMQAYFIAKNIKNFYSVSISGYHIAEAGANPITQLAFTLANGFTYVEYYLARGMDIDDFAPNLSFFFSNGIDAEYAVIGRVARRIWAKAIKLKYGGNERSQKLKYHIQTSGRSLHAQEIAFNDIRTTLQALYAIYDRCNSLHTNAYDEAITTPTEESVRRAMAIQLIINHELGLAKNENPLQGSFIIEELTDLVEKAVLEEFERISRRGGVLGAMESMYQRTKIQEESMLYEELKHSGKLPIMGVNTFLSNEGSPIVQPEAVVRATSEEKAQQINNTRVMKVVNAAVTSKALENLQETATSRQNTFKALMDVTKFCTLGQITQALFEVGGKYRRNM